MHRFRLQFLLLAVAAVASTSPSASAQDDDPLVRAVREQEALRDRQAQGIRRAEHQAFSPLTHDPTVSPGLQGTTPAPAANPIRRTTPTPQVGYLPWALGGFALCTLALLGWFVLRRARDARG